MDQRELIRSGEYAVRLAALPYWERVAFEWERAGNRPIDLARKTGKSKQAVWNLLNRARKKMQGVQVSPQRPPLQA